MDIDKTETADKDTTLTNTSDEEIVQPTLSSAIGSEHTPQKPSSTKKRFFLKRISIFLLALFTVSSIAAGVVFGFNYFNNLNKKEDVAIYKSAGNGFLEIPKDISKEQAMNPTKQQSSAIFKQIYRAINVNDFVNKNGMVVSLMKDGEVISSNKDKKRQAFFTNTAYAQTVNKNTYILADPPDDTFGTWTDAEKSIMQDTISKAYELCLELLGEPAFTDTVKIYKKDGRAYYSSWGIDGSKTIVLSATDNPDVVAHEMAHSFHSNYVFNNRGWEEGMAIFVQDRYRAKYQGLGMMMSSENYIDLNQPIISTSNFYSDTYNSMLEPVSESDHYFMAGYAMSKIYLENNDYIKNFNEQYYISQDQGQWDERGIRDVFTNLIPSIEGKTSANWLYSNYILISDPNNSQRLSRMMGKIIFLMRDKDTWPSIIYYKNARVSQKVTTLDGIQILDYQLTTNDMGSIDNSLFGKVPKSDFYKIILDAESQDGAVAHQEYIEYISTDKTENTLRSDNNSIFGVTESNTEISALGPDNVKLVGTINGNYFRIDGAKPMTKYTITQGAKEINKNIIRTPELVLDFLDDSSDNETASVNWSYPSDPQFVKGGLKDPTLVFKDNKVDYKQPFITVCANIDGDYFADSVTLNNKGVKITKSSFCSAVDLKDGINEFTIKVTPQNGPTLISKRIINKIGTATGSYQDLDNIFGSFSIINDTDDSTKASMDVWVQLYSKNNDKVLKDVLYGITVNGVYYNPDTNPYDDSPNAHLFNIETLESLKIPYEIGNEYKNNIILKLGEYPFETGNKQVCLVIDVLNKFPESDENDNMMCGYINIQ